MWGAQSTFGFGNFAGPGVSEERIRRQLCLTPLVQSIRAGIIPDMTKEQALGLIVDLKAEGNDLYKDKDYLMAGEYYTCALCMAKVLQTGHFVDVDKELLSTLFTNRAAVFNKLDQFPTAVEDCDFAIMFNKQNIKAYYRKAVALKSLRNYQEAIKVADAGRRIPGIKPAELHDFKELMKEIESHLMPSFSVPSGQRRGEQATSLLQQPAAGQPVHTASSQVAATAAVSKAKTKNVDMSWLEGTNAAVTSKHTAQAKSAPEKPKKIKKKTKKATIKGVEYRGKYSALLNYDSTEELSTDDQEIDDENHMVANVVSSMDTNTSNGITDTVSVGNTSEHQNINNLQQPLANSPLEKIKSEGMIQHDRVPSRQMGLDTFGSDVATSSMSVRSSYLQPEHQTLKTTGGFMPITTQEQLPYPFSTAYDFTFACSLCFDDSKPVPVMQPNLAHHCTKELFIVHPKNAPDNQWFNIRSRPKNNFTGQYVMCKDLVNGVSCKVPRHLCTFCHSEAEKHIWTLDRSGQFDMASFVNRWQTYALKSGSGLATSFTSVTSSYPQPVHQANKATGGFLPITTQEQLPYPFSTAYDFTFACPLCFDDSTPVPVMQPNLAHHCTKELFIVHPKNAPDNQWFNIRSRPKNDYTGQYVMCKDLVSGVSCKVPRHLCRFCHSEAEKHIWTLDRSGQFDMASFVNKWQAYALKSANLQSPLSGTQQMTHVQMSSSQQTTQNMMSDANPVQTSPYLYKSAVQEADGTKQVIQRYAFPLKDSHRFRVVCFNCLQQTGILGQYLLNQLSHACRENILIVQRKMSNTWLHIRERTKTSIVGKYVLCRFFGSSVPCKDKEKCGYAHNEEEQTLWNLEKEGKFSIFEFILQNRSPKTRRCFTPSDLFQKHMGWFQFICNSCFYGYPCRISVQHEKSPHLCSFLAHAWLTNLLLIHVNLEGMITPIAERPFKHKGAFYFLCHKMKFCQRQLQKQCNFAHSMVERDVWLLERDTDISRDELVNQSKLFLMKQGQKQSASTKAEASEQEKEKPTFKYRIIEVCSLCWKMGRKIQQDKTRHDRCAGSGMGHIWSQNKAYVVLPENRLLRPLPKRIPNKCRWSICKHVQQKGKCTYEGSSTCQFAHSQLDMEIWTWMVNNKVSTLEELYHLSEQAQKSASTAVKPIPKGQTVVWAKAVTGSQPTNKGSPFELPVNCLYCHYCSVQCNGQKQWDLHCASEKHRFNLNSDKEHQWNYRQPPWGVSQGNYELCKLHLEMKCPYSNKPDMCNFCKGAHSQEELDEWKERWKWRQMKRSIARKEQMFSFTEELLEEYQNAHDSITVISEEVPDVQISCDSELYIYKETKTSTHTWVFHLTTTSNKCLQRVALLHNHDRLHFHLVTNEDGVETQMANGDTFLTSQDPPIYEVVVGFKGGIFGSFMQWVVFDFGDRPVLTRKLGVELGTQFIQEKVKRLREQMTFNRWTTENRHIIRYTDIKDQREKTFEDELLKRYKSPASADMVISQRSVGTELNRHNYVHKMHALLEIEEIKRAQIIASYNLEVDMELCHLIEEKDAILNSKKDELFAKIPLSDQLSEDTDAGKLILSSVTSVLIAPTGSRDNKVYEAVMVTMENFDYDGRGRDYIYICLSSRCVHDLELVSGSFIEVQLQFQMDRLPFCRMHFAVDQLENNDVVFPDISRINADWNEKQVFRISSKVLNEDQLNIVQHIIAEHQAYSPPIIVYGPFGTGKTETLAQATMLLVKENYESRVLICTHSNSAADLYITKHFDSFVTKNPDISILRVYSQERRLKTVSPQVRKYCLLSQDKQSFVVPIRENILSHHIVITTLSMSITLSRIKDLKGFFSHIFIDEAAQAMECEAIMPLPLATDTTCIVLAGDHMQLSPKIYSEEAKYQKFHRSLLERLYHYYDNYHRSGNNTSPLNILLSINYRTKMEILRFISATFYGSPDRLHEASSLPDADGIIPLTFYTARGKEMQDLDSTTYYNMAEVEEVVARVSELYENWPPQWGERKQENIGVVSPYAEQVNKIRRQLRRNKLSGIVVERVMNIQGKEFLALFLSTVRTIHLVDQPPEITKAMTECDGDVGDFGFLSDNKLLNTTFTRARSFIGVVGDPMALCAIGECVFIWRAYLKHCHNLGSIKPENITLQSIRTEVESLMKTEKGHNLEMLNNLSKLIKEKKFIQVKTSQPSDGQANADNGDSEQLSLSGAEHLEAAGADGNWSLDHQLKTDDIIKQLAVDALKVCQPELEKSKLAAAIANGKQNAEPLIDCVKIKEDKGHAVLLYKPKHTTAAPKRQLLSADDHDKEYDSDDNLEQEDASIQHVDFTQRQLLELIQKQPETHKHCIIHIENSSRMYATVKDAASDLKEIKITSRARCGHAFDSDEVVVELLPVDEEDAQILDADAVRQGRVIGILRRHINPQYRTFVCMVEEGNSGLMVPLNRGIPKIYNLETKNHQKKTRRGYVCVYRLTRDLQIQFDHYEPVDSSNVMGKLFIVRYLKWDPRCYLPLGIVVGTLPAGTTVEYGLRILDIEFCIPKKFQNETEKQATALLSKSIPASELGRRLDFRDHLTFTIDPEDSEDLDDAVSFESLPNGQFRIGIHIADVSFFFKKNSALDREARVRATSYYPVGGTPIPMLPKELSSNICSLKPKQDRLTLSLFIITTNSAQIVDIQFRRCIINSHYRFSYNDVEDILDGQQPNHPVTNDLLHLHNIAKRWRIQRLGNQGLYPNLEPEACGSPKAHLLVQELMIKANHHVAMLLLQYYPTCVPLWTQPPPNELALDEWRQKNASVAKNSILLTKPYLSKDMVCTCSDQCNCIKTEADRQSNTVNVVADDWEQLKAALIEEDEYVTEDLIMLAAKPENSPEILLALIQYYNLQRHGTYACSGGLPEDLQRHYGLNIMGYTHFTSPLRRYMDLVVHRLVVSVLTKQSCPYSEQEISNLCVHCTDAIQRSRHYERATSALQLSSLIKTNPATVLSLVETVDESQMQLRFLHVKDVSPALGRVNMSLLGLSDRPSTNEEDVLIKWEERIYDLDADKNKDISIVQEAKLNPDRHIVRIPANNWCQLLFSIIQDDTQNMLMNLLAANENLVNPLLDDKYTNDVNCEVQHIQDNKYFCQFSLQVRPTSLLQIQLNSDLYRGLLAPRMQLLKLTPTLDICVEHRSNPALCFATMTSHQASKPQYRDEESYQSSWLRLLALESAHESVTSGDSFTIHNVKIVWYKTNDKVTGTLSLPWQFCKDRSIEFSRNRPKQNEKNDEERPHLDYICVRYPHISPPDVTSEHLPDIFDIDFEQPFTWVGHCLSLGCEVVKQSGRITLTIKLHKYSVPMPEVLLDAGSDNKATIEVIPKPMTYSYLEAAILDLKRATPLSRSIALGQKPPELDKVYQESLKEVWYLKVPNLPEPNYIQQSVISKCLSQSFSLIQGPPGTGKTVTGVQIAYKLCFHNNREQTKNPVKQQVLCCGPSNRSVDVFAAMLKKTGKSSPKMVRVYSETIEQQEFPSPTDVVYRKRLRQQAHIISSEISDIALHHMIRNPSECLLAETILNFDDQIRRHKAGDMSVNQVDAEEYTDVLTAAKNEVLKRCQIILTTCKASASLQSKYNTNIKQLIIDECGMCTEPESMLPIIMSGAQQVFLLGDHKQLQPVVINNQASKLGLNTSLFERYSSKAHMLTQQYRMHEAIAEFPSVQFYDGQLQCGRDEQSKPSQLKFWPNGRTKPICFVHVMGKEEALTVSTTEGSEQSKMNREEVGQAVRVATLLVRRFHVKPSAVVILTQYRAQCTELQKGLLKRDERDINVSTVVSAQGSEWDYVILSTVRSLPKSEIETCPTNGWCQRKLGFITNHHQINVAITRAKKGLIIIGNKYLLACDEMWKRLLDHYEKNQKVVNASNFMT